MTNNIIPIRGRPFNPGFDPRRNLDGARKGTNPLILIKKRALEKHSQNIDDVIQIIFDQAMEGNEKSQDLICRLFVLNAVADLAADNCEDTLDLEEITNIPKEELEDMRSIFADKLNKYNGEQGNE
jgi:hypothetical protein